MGSHGHRLGAAEAGSAAPGEAAGRLRDRSAPALLSSRGTDAGDNDGRGDGLHFVRVRECGAPRWWRFLLQRFFVPLPCPRTDSDGLRSRRLLLNLTVSLFQ